MANGCGVLGAYQMPATLIPCGSDLSVFATINQMFSPQIVLDSACIVVPSTFDGRAEERTRALRRSMRDPLSSGTWSSPSWNAFHAP